MGHQPVADMNNWFAPTTAGTKANHELTLTINTVPTKVKVPASRKRTLCLVPATFLLQDGGLEEPRDVWGEFIESVYLLGYRVITREVNKDPMGYVDILGGPYTASPKHEPDDFIFDDSRPTPILLD